MLMFSQLDSDGDNIFHIFIELYIQLIINAM